jgi:hypothetical protein
MYPSWEMIADNLADVLKDLDQLTSDGGVCKCDPSIGSEGYTCLNCRIKTVLAVYKHKREDDH